MDEYISKQAFKEKYLCCGWLPEISEEEFDTFPAAAVPVVRCRECSHSQEYLDDELFCLCFEDVVPLYGYCYKGKRKEDEHEVN